MGVIILVVSDEYINGRIGFFLTLKLFYLEYVFYVFLRGF